MTIEQKLQNRCWENELSQGGPNRPSVHEAGINAIWLKLSDGVYEKDIFARVPSHPKPFNPAIGKGLPKLCLAVALHSQGHCRNETHRFWRAQTKNIEFKAIKAERSGPIVLSKTYAQVFDIMFFSLVATIKYSLPIPKAYVLARVYDKFHHPFR